MTNDSLRSIMERRGFVAGAFLNLGSPVSTEFCASQLDWVLIDQEHGPGGPETLLAQLMAARAGGAASVVRVADLDPARVKRVLDFGADGLMFPQVKDVADVSGAVRAMRYPPAGIRGVSKVNRSCNLGLDFESRFRDLGKSLLGVMQIETVEALENVDEIAAVDGVNVLFVGPLDLSVNLGCPGDIQHPDFISALEKVSKAAEARGKWAGILLPDPSAIDQALERGFRFLAVGSDGGWVAAGVSQLAAAVQSCSKSKP